MFARKLVKWEIFLLRFGSTLFSMSSQLRFAPWLRFFEQNFIVKWVIFFDRFCWFWDSLPLYYKIWNKRLYVVGDYKETVWLKQYFHKKITNMRFWIIYILVQIAFFFFVGGRGRGEERKMLYDVSGSVFFNFLSSANRGGQHFYSALQRYNLSFFLLNTFKIFFGKPSILWKIWKWRK